MTETPEVQAITPSAQALGRAGGLWTHTPVDWRGNETGGKPGNWPTDASLGQPGLGTRPLEQMPAPGLTVLVSTPGTGQASGKIYIQVGRDSFLVQFLFTVSSSLI